MTGSCRRPPRPRRSLEEGRELAGGFPGTPRAVEPHATLHGPLEAKAHRPLLAGTFRRRRDGRASSGRRLPLCDAEPGASSTGSAVRNIGRGRARAHLGLGDDALTDLAPARQRFPASPTCWKATKILPRPHGSTWEKAWDAPSARKAFSPRWKPKPDAAQARSSADRSRLMINNYGVNNYGDTLLNPSAVSGSALMIAAESRIFDRR